MQNAKLLGLSGGHNTSKGGVGPDKKTLTSTQWQTAIMIFYVGLVLFQVPGTIGKLASSHFKSGTDY